MGDTEAWIFSLGENNTDPSVQLKQRHKGRNTPGVTLSLGRHSAMPGDLFVVVMRGGGRGTGMGVRGCYWHNVGWGPGMNKTSWRAQNDH